MSLFKAIYIEDFFGSEPIIYWDLNFSTGTHRFTVQRSHDPNGDWETLNTTPLTETYSYTDTTRKFYAKTPDLFYRVKVVVGATTEYSDPMTPDGGLNRHDWLIARELYRRAVLQFQKYQAIKGYLLKRKIWGNKCPYCVDPNTGEPLSSLCPKCFGTGLIGGYYSKIDYYIAKDQKAKTADTSDIGTVEPTQFMGESVAYPHIYPKDMWVSDVTSERFYILNISDGSAIKGIPITYHLGLQLIPKSDILYTVPV